MLSCEQSAVKTREIEFYNINQDQFTFLVFEKYKVDSFILIYEPLIFSNKIIKHDLNNLVLDNFDNKSESNLQLYNKNSNVCNADDFKLAMDVIKATYEQEGKKYFSGSLAYLFFNKCLPYDFRNKWPQTTRGDFRFNATFFSILRDKSEIIDKIIYGEIGYRDQKLLPIYI